MTEAKKWKTGAPPRKGMPHRKRILIRAIIRVLERTPLGSRLKGVRRAVLRQDLSDADPYGGTPARRTRRANRLLDRYFRSDHPIEKVRRGTVFLRVEPPWLREFAYDYQDELREGLNKLKDFIHDMETRCDGPLTTQGKKAKEEFLKLLQTIITRGRVDGPSVAAPPVVVAPSVQRMARWRAEKRLRRVKLRTTITLIRLMWEVRKKRAKEGLRAHVPARVWERFFSEFVEEALDFLVPIVVEPEGRSRWHRASFKQKVTAELSGVLKEVPRLFEGVELAELPAVVSAIINDIVDRLDQVADEGPYAFKSHRDPRLHLRGWDLFKVLLNNLFGRSPP